jgi:hypothetical protein
VFGIKTVRLFAGVLASTVAVIAPASPRAGGSTPAGSTDALDLSTLCTKHNCDNAFANLRSGKSYFLPAGVWTFTKPFSVPSNVTLTGDGTGIAQGTDLVYSGPSVSGAVVSAGSAGADWVNGHLAGLEIETNQLHQWRLRGDQAWATVRVDEAAVGLEVFNPTASSTVDNVNIWKFGTSSLLVDNHAMSPGAGSFQISDFFVGTSPHPIEVHGSRAKLLLRFGGVDLGPLSQLAVLFRGDTSGATSVVESVKIEGDYDVPGFVVEGGAPVVFVGSTRYMNQSLYTEDPMNDAAAYLNRNASLSTSAVQCLACTALGERTALALPDMSFAVPASKWGINLHELTSAAAGAVTAALATPEIPFARPHAVVNLAPLCLAHDCNAAFAGMKWGGRYYLPDGVWQFSHPFTIPYGVTLFGDGEKPGNQGGTELQYVGASLPGNAAIKFGAGSGDMAGRLFSLRLDTKEQLAGGVGLRARDATNGGTIEDVAISGFPDGQMLVDATSASTSGPNFFRIARFTLSGGTHPLEIQGGRENLLVEQGTIALGASSREGLYLLGGEQLAATRTIESVSVTGNVDVPGFRVFGPAVTLFARSRRTSSSIGLNSPGFVYDALVPRAVAECLSCSAIGVKTAFSIPAFGIAIPADGGTSFDYMNPNTALQQLKNPFNVDLPAEVGHARVGQTLTAATGNWINGPTGFSFQWVRCKPANVPSDPATRCSKIAGATNSAYTVLSADVGFYVRVKVTATNAAGMGAATSLPLLASG